MKLEELIAAIFVTTVVLIILSICTIVVCIVRCSLLRSGYEFCPRRLPSSRQWRDDEEMNIDQDDKTGDRDLSEAPPPSYRHINQYQTVNIDSVVRLKSIHRLSSHTEPHAEPETTSLPPDYTSTRGDDVTSERVSNGVGPQEMQITEGGLPPTYSTAQTKQPATRHSIEVRTPEVAVLYEDGSTISEDIPFTGEHCHIHSYTRVDENYNIP